MKKIILAVMIMVPALLMAQESFKIGYINSQELIISMPEYDAAAKQIEDMRLTYTTEGRKLEEELQKKANELYQSRDSLDSTIREYKETELQRLQQSIEEFSQNAQANLQKKSQELMTPIYDKVSKSIKQVGDENGFTYIIETGAGQILPYIGAKAENVLPLVKKVLNLK